MGCQSSSKSDDGRQSSIPNHKISRFSWSNYKVSGRKVSGRKSPETETRQIRGPLAENSASALDYSAASRATALEQRRKDIMLSELAKHYAFLPL